MNKLKFAALAALLSGCATVPLDTTQSVPPATITFSSFAQTGRVLPFVYGTASDCSNRRELGAKSGPAEWKTEIPAGIPVSMALYWDDLKAIKYTSCNFTWSFVPGAGKQYAARIDLSGSQCFVDLQEVSAGGAPLKRVEDIRFRRYRAPWGGGGSWCHPLE